MGSEISNKAVGCFCWLDILRKMNAQLKMNKTQCNITALCTENQIGGFKLGRKCAFQLPPPPPPPQKKKKKKEEKKERKQQQQQQQQQHVSLYMSCSTQAPPVKDAKGSRSNIGRSIGC